MEVELFSAALGVKEPLYIDRIEFDNDDGELNIHMNFYHGSRFDCALCGQPGQKIHDTVWKKWRHLNFFQYKCYISLPTPRTDCDVCGVRLWVPPWGRSQSGFTVLFEAFVMTLAKEMPIVRIAELVGEQDTRLWRVVKHHVNLAYMQKDFSEVTKVAIDETSSKKGHNYVTVAADLESKEVMFATEGKGSDTIEAFAVELTFHAAEPSQIKEVSMDMSPAFISGAAKHLPDASVTFDKFHVIQALNKALDEVRRGEQKQNPLLKSTRYVWLKNPENLTVGQQEKLKSLSGENTKTAKAYKMKLTFQDIYKNISEPEAAEVAIKKWLSCAVRSRLEPIKKFAKMVKSHFDGIMRYFTSRLTSGAIEGINSRIQEVKRRARGFRNINNFIIMIYLEAGGLDIKVTHLK